MIAGSDLIPEFDIEMATTRRLLERVPGDRAEWRPHAKSFRLAHLAQLISWMPGWITNTMRESGLDIGGAPGYSVESTATLLALFDQNVREAREALALGQAADFQDPWSLRHSGRVIFTMPRGAVVRMHLSHLIHHRGQLTVYLRLLDVPIPQIYGPTADERAPSFP